MFDKIKNTPLDIKILLLILFVSLFTVSNLKADYLLLNFERCATDYKYIYDTTASEYKLSYLNSRTGNWNDTTANVGAILSGYDYNSTTEQCTPNNVLTSLKIDNKTYNSYMALTGLFSAFLVTSTIFFILTRV